MRPLIWKELRENAGWALILFAGVSVALSVWILNEGGRVDENFGSDDVLAVILFAAPLGAAALGALQTRPELGGDAWAFLIHRPVPATRIFLAKAIAGTGLYLAALLVPFCALALWVAAGAPERRVFHASMLWPGVAFVLASAGFHGAAMLVVLRRARWLGTRLLPLVLPAGTLAATIHWILDVNELPSPALLLFILASLAVTGLAARGSFAAGGEARGQPLPARVALGLSLGIGAVGVLAGSLALCVAAVSELRPPHVPARPVAVGEPRAPGPESPVLHRFGARPGRERIAIGLFDALGAADEWVHSTPHGTLFGYRAVRDAWGRRISSRLVSQVGPDGFHAPPSVPLRRFGRFLRARWRDRSGLEDPMQNPRTRIVFSRPERSERRHRAVLACEEAIYDIDFAREEVRLVLAAPEGESFRGVSLETASDGVEIALATDRSVLFYTAREEVAGEVTDTATGERADIAIFLPGREIARAAIPDSIRGARSLAVSRAGGGYTFLVRRDAPAFSIARHVETDALGSVVAERSAFREGEDAGLARACLAAAASFTPVALVGAAALADEILLAGGGPGFLRLSAAERPGWILGLAAILAVQALGCAAAAWFAVRRHGFSPAAQRVWVALGALLGPSGLVALRGTRDWPPLAPCAACGRQRALDIDRCPFCGAGIEPPPRDGTEVIQRNRRKELMNTEIGSVP